MTLIIDVSPDSMSHKDRVSGVHIHRAKSHCRTAHCAVSKTISLKAMNACKINKGHGPVSVTNAVAPPHPFATQLYV